MINPRDDGKKTSKKLNVWLLLNAQLIVTIFTLTAPSKAAGQEVPIPRSMASLGDSITAGALAGFRRQDAAMPWTQASFLLKVISYKLENDYSQIEFPALSWAAGYDTGESVVSHARRLIELQGGSNSAVKVFNGGVSGATVDDSLNLQWPRVQNWARQKLGQEAPDYMTILIGANDICADDVQGMLSNDDYQRKLSLIVDDITHASPKTHILISALPNIEHLRTAAKDASDSIVGIGKCENVWRAFNLCKTLTLLENKGDRDMVAQRVWDYNHIMEDVAQKANIQVGDDHVRVAMSIYDKDLQPNDLSMDCFHPNPGGQNKISAETWKNTWWGSKFTPDKDAALQKKAWRAAHCAHGRSRTSGLAGCGY